MYENVAPHAWSPPNFPIPIKRQRDMHFGTEPPKPRRLAKAQKSSGSPIKLRFALRRKSVCLLSAPIHSKSCICYFSFSTFSTTSGVCFSLKANSNGSKRYGFGTVLTQIKGNATQPYSSVLRQTAHRRVPALSTAKKFSQALKFAPFNWNRRDFENIMEMPERSNNECERGFTGPVVFDHNVITGPDNTHGGRHSESSAAWTYLYCRHDWDWLQSLSGPHARPTVYMLLIVGNLVANLPINAAVNDKSFERVFLLLDQRVVASNPFAQRICSQDEVIKIISVEMIHQTPEYSP